MRFAAGVPRPLSDFWSLAEHRDGAEIEFRGPGAYSPETAAAGVTSGRGVALTTASLVRQFPCALSLVELTSKPLTTVWLTSRLADRRPLLDTVHREAARIADRLTPLLMPDVVPPAEGAAAGKMVG